MKFITINRYDESTRALVLANESRRSIRVRAGADDISTTLNIAERAGWIMLGFGTLTVLGLGWLGKKDIIGERETS